MRNAWSACVARLKKDPLLTGLLLLECLILLYLGAQLWKAPIRLEVPPSSFLVASPRSAQLNEGETALVIGSSAETVETEDILSDFYSVSAGAYELTVHYHSVLNPAAPSNSMADSTATLSVRSFTNPSAVTGDSLVLCDGRNVTSTRVYVSLTGRIRDFQLVFTYAGKGQLQIDSVSLQEQPVWRWTRLAVAILLFVVVNLCYTALLAKNAQRFETRIHTRRHAIVLLLIPLFASLPLAANFLFDGHDLTFHLARIGALAAELEKGQFPVRMLSTMLNGYGYPTPLYYCDLLLYFSALLYNAMVPLMTCYQAYVLLVNAATCLTAYLCFSRMTGQKTIGVAFAALYTLSPQRLMTLYIRAAVGEYSAMIFLPLIMWGLWNLYHRREDLPIAFRAYLPLALGVAGIIQSHVLTLEMTALFLLGFGLVTLRRTLQRHRLWALLKAAALALGLSLWFFGPLLETMAGMSVWGNQAHVVSKMQNFGLYPVQLLGLFQPASGGNTADGLLGEMPLTLGLPLMLCLFMACYVLLHRNRWALESQEGYAALPVSGLIGLCAVAMTLYIFPWDSLENWLGATLAHYGGIVQFPWRYLSIAMIALSATGAFAFQLLRAHDPVLYRRMTAILMGALLLSTGYFFSSYTNATGTRQVYDQNSLPQGIYGSIGAGEFLLTDVDIADIQHPSVAVDSDSLTVTGYATDAHGVLLTCTNGQTEATALLPIFCYDHYETYNAATGEAIPLAEGRNRRIALRIPAHFQGNIRVCYVPPIRWRLYEGVSVLAWLCVAFLLIRTRRKSPAVSGSQKSAVQ